MVAMQQGYLKVPAGQGMGSAVPVALVYVPGGAAVHDADVALLY